MPTILAIDDEQIYLKMIAHALKPLGYEVQFATNGKQGITTAVASQPDVIISDVMMPEMNGYEMTKNLRRDPRFSQTPILILTSQAELGDKLLAFEAGADDYMSKPFEPAELVARLEGGSDAARVFCVHSLRGGAGCSSFAVNLAVGLWELWNKPTILIDSVQTAGQIAVMINSSLKRTWVDIADVTADELDFEYLDTIIGKHQNGIHFITGPTTPISAEMVKKDTIQASIELVSPRYDYVVCDLPHDFSEISVTLLNAAETIILLLAPEMASIRAAVAALNVYKRLGYEDDKIKVVLNWTFKSPGLDQEQIERALSIPINLIVPHAPEQFIVALNLGMPILLHSPESQISTIFENIAYRLSKENHKSLPPGVPTKTWQRVNKRLKKGKRW
jgi:pilus assembly protein CpaE